MLPPRPTPPKSLIEDFFPYIKIEPAPEIANWVNEHILNENGEIYNNDHFHLIDADIGFLWAASPFTKKGKNILGQCEEVAFRAGGWQKARMEQQMYNWFGRVPDFVITLADDYCSICSDLDFCALVEHELYHIAQKTDEYGSPKFTQEGLPKLQIRSHDIEEFIGVVRRYGASDEIKQLVKTAEAKPEIGNAEIARACGTCALKIVKT